MTFMIQFRCTECGREQLVDLDDRKLTHIICPNRECRHHAPKPDGELAEELRHDTGTMLKMNIVTGVLITVFLGALALAFASFWPDAEGNTPVEIATNAYIGFGLAFASFFGIIMAQLRTANADTACDY